MKSLELKLIINKRICVWCCRTWGIISMTIAFVWQLYTLWLLVHLHESVEKGVRYSRYLQLCFATFGMICPRVPYLFILTFLNSSYSFFFLSNQKKKNFFQLINHINSCLNQFFYFIKF